MNKKMMALCLIGVLAGCTYAGERTLGEYMHDPKTWIKDPHFANYKEKRDQLESQYLQKEISYSEYLEQRTALDDQYAREVREREKIISQGAGYGQ